MRWYTRALLTFANEGVTGVFRDASSRLRKTHVAYAGAREELAGLDRQFYDKIRDRDEPDIDRFLWYHTIDLGNGIITPGTYDYRSNLAAFGFPSDMNGLNVLDIGSATGFFSFEFERRGANVTSVEVPSMAYWDHFPGETSEEMLAKHLKFLPTTKLVSSEDVDRLYRSCTPAELYWLLLDGPFKFCHKTLKSRVVRCYSTVYDLPQQLEGRSFDLVFIGDMLLHTIDPIKALAAAASLCSGTLIIAQQVSDYVLGLEPMMLYVGGEIPGDDRVIWLLPNRLCLEQLLKKLGFSSVKLVGTHAGYTRPAGQRYDRSVMHAKR